MCWQVPQMLLEEAWGAGRGARIMCTQPRRISAVSVAERIAQERGEPIGENIGYTIRLDTKCGTGLLGHGIRAQAALYVICTMCSCQPAGERRSL